jgi:hypothetical protein
MPQCAVARAATIANTVDLNCSVPRESWPWRSLTVNKPWATLCRHPLGPEVGQHSVNPCLVAGARNVISGREPAVQGANRPVLLGFTDSVSRRCSKPTGLLTIASRRSLMTALLRRETGGRGEARTPIVVNLWGQAAGRARVPCSVGLQLWIANSRQVPGTPFNS